MLLTIKAGKGGKTEQPVQLTIVSASTISNRARSAVT